MSIREREHNNVGEEEKIYLAGSCWGSRPMAPLSLEVNLGFACNNEHHEG